MVPSRGVGQRPEARPRRVLLREQRHLHWRVACSPKVRVPPPRGGSHRVRMSVTKNQNHEQSPLVTSAWPFTALGLERGDALPGRCRLPGAHPRALRWGGRGYRRTFWSLSSSRDLCLLPKPTGLQAGGQGRPAARPVHAWARSSRRALLGPREATWAVCPSPQAPLEVNAGS